MAAFGQLNVAFRELRDGVDRHVRDMPEAASTYEALSAQLRQSIDAENEFTATAGEGVADISRWASILLRFAPQFEELLNLSGESRTPSRQEHQCTRSCRTDPFGRSWFASLASEHAPGAPGIGPWHLDGASGVLVFRSAAVVDGQVG